MAKRKINPQDPTEFDQLFADAEQRNNLPPGLIKALAYQESRFNPNAHNKKSGAHGITQWMAKSAKGWKVNRYDPKSSIDGTGRYLRSLIDRFGGRVDLALAGYNGGEGNVERWLKDGTWITNDAHIRPKENIEYPEKIFGHMGIRYKSSSSPMLGRSFKRFAKGENATAIMPDGASTYMPPFKPEMVGEVGALGVSPETNAGMQLSTKPVPIPTQQVSVPTQTPPTVLTTLDQFSNQQPIFDPYSLADWWQVQGIE